MLHSQQLNKNFHYKEKVPSYSLQNFIMYFWELRAKGTDVYHVLPDACVDFIVNCNSEEGFLISPSPTKAISFEIDKHSLWFGVRFRPMIVYSLFRLPISELNGETVYLDLIDKKLFEELKIKIMDKKTLDERALFFEAFLCDYIKKMNFEMDVRLANSLEIIYKYHGSKRVEKEVASIISPRQLRRLFKEQIGMSPKDFSKIIRFQSLINSYSKNDLDIYRLNYYDQAHFINDVRQMSGLSPKQLFNQL